MKQETAIRIGDKVTWEAPQFSGGSKCRGRVTGAKFIGTKKFSGTVLKHSYGEKTNQHTFTILVNGKKKLVKGRNLYPNLIEHIPDPNSIDRK